VLHSRALRAATLVNGVATFTTSLLPKGKHNVTVRYVGNTSFLGSDDFANPLVQTVK
jgi:hypothetical protein